MPTLQRTAGGLGPGRPADPAVKDGDEWIINGQKVWTSGGQYADLGMLLARTDSDVPKHQGISYFAFDMLQDGVDVRPLKEMTGHASSTRSSSPTPGWPTRPSSAASTTGGRPPTRP